MQTQFMQNLINSKIAIIASIFIEQDLLYYKYRFRVPGIP